jgi:hypothetical protein
MESLLSYLIAASFVILAICLYVDDYRAAKRQRETFTHRATTGYFMTGNAGGGFSAADFTGGCDGGGGGDGGGGSC